MDPSGPISEQLEVLEDLLAGCPAFQQFVRAASADAARAFIHWGINQDVDGVSESPYAVIDTGDAWGYERIASGADHQLRNSGELAVYLTAFDSFSRESNREAIRSGIIEFYNAIGAIAEYLAETAGGEPEAGPLSLVGVQFVVPPGRNPIRGSAENNELARWDCTLSLAVAD